MLLSVVSGTFNRLKYLKAMLESVEKSAPRGVEWEACICDGGSTDGTLEYLRTHPRVKLLEHGSLKGGIAAFNDAAKMAAGDYILVANDDVEIENYSIAKALAHLMDHPDVGGVAFYQDRNGRELHVETMPMLDSDGHEIALPYIQVGILPRFLWEAAGGWGDWGGRTYGGDNYLTMRLYQMGYQVVTIKGCSIHDATPIDELRARNNTNNNDGQIFWDKFGHQKIAPYPVMPNPLQPRKRVLYAPIIEKGHVVQKVQKRGMRDALGTLGEVMEVDYVYGEEDILEAAKAWQPHFVFAQFHEADEKRVELAIELRKIRREWMVSWDGDVWAKQQTDPNYLEMLRNFDCHTCVNATLFPIYEAKGVHAAYLQNSFEPAILPTNESEIQSIRDVIFLGNNYSPYRTALATKLKSLPFDVDIFGRGYNYADGTPVMVGKKELSSGESLYDFAKTGDLYRSSKIAIADNQFPEAIGFASDRLFMILAAGGCLLMHQRVQKLDELLGLVDGVHYIVWDDFTDLEAKIQYYLEHEDERAKIAEAGTAFCREKHSYAQRVGELQALITNIKPNHRRISACVIVKNEMPRIPDLLEQLDWADEVVIVDTGSDDGTAEHLYEVCGFTSEPPEEKGVQRRVLGRFEWDNDFSAARNYALSLCTMEWVLWLDADDVLPQEFQDTMRTFPTAAWKNHTTQAFAFPCIDSKSEQQTLQVRLFRNVRGVAFSGWAGSSGRIHETVNRSLNKLGIRPVGYTAHQIIHAGNESQEAVDRKQARNLRILAMEPDGAQKYYHVASALAAMKLYDLAAGSVTRAIAMLEAKDRPNIGLLAFLRFFLGYCFDEAGKTEEARDALIQSQFPDALFLLADIDHRQGKANPTLYAAYLKSELPQEFPSFSKTWRPTAEKRITDFVDNWLLENGLHPIIYRQKEAAPAVPGN